MHNNTENETHRQKKQATLKMNRHWYNAPVTTGNRYSHAKALQTGRK